MKLTHARFAQQASCIAKSAAGWAGDSLMLPGHIEKPIDDAALARFIIEIQDTLDRLWFWDVEGEPQPPAEGEPGSSAANPRSSTLWAGRYAGKCPHCGAYMVAARRAPRCDPCEFSHRAAHELRRSALDAARQGG